MRQKKKFLTFLKFLMTALLGLVVAYAAYQKIKIPGLKSKPPIKEVPVSVQANASLKDNLVAYGMEFLGTPYVSAGCSKEGFDCSGFVYFVFKHFKIEVPRSSSGFEHFGTEIPIESVRKGDILLFLSPTRDVIGHVGIVSNPKGKASDFIHASSGREMKVIITSLATEGYTRRFVKAIRVL